MRSFWNRQVHKRILLSCQIENKEFFELCKGVGVFVLVVTASVAVKLVIGDQHFAFGGLVVGNVRNLFEFFFRVEIKLLNFVLLQFFVAASNNPNHMVFICLHVGGSKFEVFILFNRLKIEFSHFVVCNFETLF